MAANSLLSFLWGIGTKTARYFFTGIVRDITARKQAENVLRQRELELQQSQEELRALGAQLISAQEDERRRLSRELHDDMNQRLAMVAIHIQSVQGSLSESDPMQETLRQLNEEVASLSDNVRRLAYQLHPSILDDLGLVVALQSFIKDFSKWEHISVTFQPKDVPGILPQDVRVMCLSGDPGMFKKCGETCAGGSCVRGGTGVRGWPPTRH